MNFILYGEQTPPINKKLKALIKERISSPDVFNVIKFDADNANLDEILDEISLMPLGCDRKMIVIDNASFLTTNGNKEWKETFSQIINNSMDEIDIVLIHHGASIDKKTEIGNNIVSKCNVSEFLNLTKEQWPIYVSKFFKSKNIEIEDAAINELVKRVDGDLNKFLNEGEKLSLYTNNIKIDDVLLMVSKPLESDAFQMCNALLNKDNGLALSIFRDLKLLGSKAPETFIPMLGSQFRFISQVLFLSSQGLSNGSIAQQLGTSEGRVYMTIKTTKNVSRKVINRSLDELYYLDYKIKSGQIDRFYGFELFLINF